MNRARGAACVLLCAALAACRTAEAEPPPAPSRLGDIVIARDSEIFNGDVPSHTTFAALLDGYRVADSESIALVAAIARQFDPRRFRAGQPYSLDLFFDGRVREFAYEIDRDRRLIARRAEAERDDFVAEVLPIAKTRALVTLHGEIGADTPSLIEALDVAAGAAADAASVSGVADRIELALALADVFSGEFDFNSDLQPGNRFRVLVEHSTREDGKFGGYGPVLAAELVTDLKPLDAVRFTLPDGKPGYYDEQGRSLKRFLLKSPLKFDPRITSGFSRGRRHPILNYTRAHNGVDYAAPTGAPVAAVAGGTVTLAGWSGGGGRTVRIRHASGYESEYLHLSAIASGVRAGVHIGQGELVGRVGATGLATGPHLHYGLRRNGRYVNPVREHLNMPPGEPVPAVHAAIFALERDRLMALLTDPGVRRAN